MEGGKEGRREGAVALMLNEDVTEQLCTVAKSSEVNENIT